MDEANQATTRQDLRATAQQLAHDASELSRIELQKSKSLPNGSAFRRLAARAEALTSRIVRLIRSQRALADELAKPPGLNGPLE